MRKLFGLDDLVLYLWILFGFGNKEMEIIFESLLSGWIFFGYLMCVFIIIVNFNFGNISIFREINFYWIYIVGLLLNRYDWIFC